MADGPPFRQGEQAPRYVTCATQGAKLLIYQHAQHARGVERHGRAAAGHAASDSVHSHPRLITGRRASLRSISARGTPATARGLSARDLLPRPLRLPNPTPRRSSARRSVVNRCAGRRGACVRTSVRPSQQRASQTFSTAAWVYVRVGGRVVVRQRRRRRRQRQRRRQWWWWCWWW